MSSSLNYPYVPRLDRRVCATNGVFAAGDTTWTLPIEDETIDTAVLSNDHGANAGKVIDVTVSGTTATATGADYSGAKEVCFGRSYSMSVELSRIVVRDSRGIPDISSETRIKGLVARHRNTGKYTVTGANIAGTTRSKTFEQANNALDIDGFARLHFMGDAEEINFTLSSDSAKPSTITSVQYENVEEDKGMIQ